MAGRIEEYKALEGHWSPSRRDAVLVPARRVAFLASSLDTLIPSRYYVATAQHETNFATNERDTEESGFQSWGLYQLSTAERAEVGMPHADLLDPDQATHVMIELARRRRLKIRAAARIADGDMDPPDLYAYLALAHNQGDHAALISIEHHGMSWTEYEKRNPKIRIVSSGYGRDCMPRA